MSSPHQTRRLYDLLDGILPPEEEQALLGELARDECLRREHTRVKALHSLLSEPLDVDPPPDLAGAVMKRIRTERLRRIRFFRLPGWAENTLVLGGSAALAAIVAIGRLAGPGWAAPWLGRLTVGAADAVGVAKDAAVGTTGSMEQMDWVVRLAGTLSGATWKVLGSSADLLVFCGLLSLVLTTVAARMLWHGGRLVRVKEGAANAHLLA